MFLESWKCSCLLLALLVTDKWKIQNLLLHCGLVISVYQHSLSYGRNTHADFTTCLLSENKHAYKSLWLWCTGRDPVWKMQISFIKEVIFDNRLILVMMVKGLLAHFWHPKCFRTSSWLKCLFIDIMWPETSQRINLAWQNVEVGILRNNFSR